MKLYVVRAEDTCNDTSLNRAVAVYSTKKAAEDHVALFEALDGDIVGIMEELELDVPDMTYVDGAG